MKKILAAVSFFTRIPAWKFTEIPAECYRHVVEVWPVAGWITGGVTALSLWITLHIFPPFLAVISAYTIRLLLTSALHEDGLADFIDGMGGGRDRARILEIMKDSAIGSYGVIGLSVYFLMLVFSVASLPMAISLLIVFAADPWSKMCAASIINFLPYARNRETAKNKLVYERLSVPAIVLCLFAGFAGGLVPLLFLRPEYLLCMIASPVVSVLMILYMRYKIGGYTGDCCGAVFLLSELAFILSASAIFKITSQPI